VSGARARSAREHRIEVDGRGIEYTVLRMARRRHVHLLVDDDGRVEVRTPWRYPASEVERLVREHAAWVGEAQERATSRRRARPRLVDGAELPLLDERLGLSVAGARRLEPSLGAHAQSRAPQPHLVLRTRAGRVWRDGARLHVVPLAAGEVPLRTLLERWYRREAKTWLPTRLAELAAPLGVSPSRIAIRGQRSRWGSCSTRGTISLNWRLMLVPRTLADYVLVHELCHLRHMNHSPRFWEMVASIVPDYGQRRVRLHAAQAGLPI
jgi:predicted metal-dependent hydrolase